MLFYYLIFFLALLVFFFSERLQEKQQNLKLLLVFMAGLCLFVGFADMLGGYDRYIYCELFDDAANVVTKGRKFGDAVIFDEYPKEYFYDWYNIIVGMITENRYVFVFITTLIIYILLFESIRRYCTNYPFAVILFLGLWFFFTFTYLRQAMAATIAWLSIKYVVDRKFWKFLIVWYIAYRFHNSALILLPLYFIPIKKFDKTQVLWVMGLCFLLGVTGIPSGLFAAYGEIDPNRTSVGNESGFRLPYMLEAGFFLWLILTHYDEVPNTKLRLVLMNMTLIFCAILLFFIKSDNGGRMSWYYMIGVISTITYLCTYTPLNRKYAFLMIVICFFLFNRIVVDWGIQLYPYKTFLSNGIRKNDIIEVMYEYDHGYDENKFYRPVFRFMKK